ncbi:MAG: hypothetical protein NTW86_04060, partial [Candidatus Sumerlaeota bacterium]|nr:hypothetical protein [Candidatus Sumerlaeota bacterium]
TLYRGRLSGASAQRLERLIRFSVEGIRRHGVGEGYTNIFLMKTWNCIALGEGLGRSDLADEGYAMLDRWLMHTWQSGIHEYLSPTYYGVDVECAGLIARYAQREEGRRKAEAVLRLFWTDVAANWFAPGQRLGGAHSREYDYLGGHGPLDAALIQEGWMTPKTPVAPSLMTLLSAWTPPAQLRAEIAAKTPRLVRQKWGLKPWETATNYVGKRFSMGSAGATYGSQDKPLVVNWPGPPETPVSYFYMDGRGDPYGKQKFAEVSGSGHEKALHLQPFLMSAQRGSEVLLLACADPAIPSHFKSGAPNPTCLLSHFTLPADAEIWIGEGAQEPLQVADRIRVAQGEAVILRKGDVAVGVRVILGADAAGKAAPVEIVNDGQKYGAMRLTCVHSAEKPQGRGVIGLWTRAAEGLDDAAFAQFRGDFSRAEANGALNGDQAELTAAGQAGPLRLAADLKKETRLACEGGEPGGEDLLLAVDGRDLGREILQAIDPVAKLRRALEAARNGGAEASAMDTVVEAESALLIVPPFRVDEDPKASGGRFVWLPGEPGGKGDGGGSGRAVFAFHIPQAGPCYLWARVLTPTPSDDSFFISIEQQGSVALPQSTWPAGAHKSWEWARVTPEGSAKDAPAVRLQEGAATVTVFPREDGAKLDALYLTADAAARPPEPKP